MEKKIFIYDATLREGAQNARVAFTTEDKIAIARKLDALGVDYIEGGWPLKGVNDGDFDFFRAFKNKPLKIAKLAAFGSTRRVGNKVQNDATLNSLLDAQTPVVTIFGKSWDMHVLKVLNTTPDENIRIISESVAYLKSKKREVIYDAEHFFDGYKANPEYAMKCLLAAQSAGADCITLCDTNGGTTVAEMEKISRIARNSVKIRLGAHMHNDSGLAVANSLVAVDSGFDDVQGTMNGWGERCGNADLASLIPILSLKYGCLTIPPQNMVKLTETSHYLYERVNVTPVDSQPFVGKNAFAHKAGVHANAVMKVSYAYEHMNPELVGNERLMLMSTQAGVSTLIHKAHEIGVRLAKDDPKTKELIVKIKKLESEGYEFEGADASLRLFILKNTSKVKEFFKLIGYKVIVEDYDGRLSDEAAIKIEVDGAVEHCVSEGNGPVNALDNALRKALKKFYKKIEDVRLVDYKVRVIEGAEGTSAKVKVFIESSDNKDVWTTVGVSENIIEASWLALKDSVEYKLLKEK
ncbi:MAG: citramalate synthase [Spirochaetia bacterium]|nr:citramalate synthase [Spirochaetia bacterium]